MPVSKPRFPFKTAVPTILNGLVAFLDSMDTHEYLPTVIEILEELAKTQEQIFDERFQVCLIFHFFGWEFMESKRRIPYG
jgi:hypothetical protein